MLMGLLDKLARHACQTQRAGLGKRPSEVSQAIAR
jgi:hypothetical protein